MIGDRAFINKLSDRIQDCSRKHFTGRLNVQDPKGQRWSLYLHEGQLVGDANGVHPVRRWRRQLAQHCQELEVNIDWDYDSLARLVRQKEHLRERMVAVVEGSLTEVLFDIIQQEELFGSRPEAQLTYTYLPQDKLNSPLIFIQADQVWKQAQQAWQNWRLADLENFSPNWAPVIWQPEELQQNTSPNAYKSLTALLDGKQTLRDLALKLKQDLTLLTKSLVPYVFEVWIGLIEVADLIKVEQVAVIPVAPSVAPPPIPTQQQLTGPLVAYVDDSAMDRQRMGQFLTKTGLRYISIQDSVQALPILIEHRPSLIFLDLVMPIANGYEICSQIRRTSIFKNTPVIIVTGNDGIVDRVRAKLVGSTDFLAKPIDAEKVLAILRKHMSPNSG